MKTQINPVVAAAAAIAICHNAGAQGLLNENGISILAPTFAPTGGYAANPQEYLSVAWTVAELSPGDYKYTYNVSNPAGDVLLNSSGGLTGTPEIFDAFSVGFNTTAAGAYLAGTQTGGFVQEQSTVSLAWFFDPSIPAGSTGTVTFQSAFGPTLGNADAMDAAPPSPWSSVAPGGNTVPVPQIIPEPSVATLLGASALLLIPLALRRNAKR